MNVELPDGTILEDVPDGTTQDQLRAKLSANGVDLDRLAPATGYKDAPPGFQVEVRGTSDSPEPVAQPQDPAQPAQTAQPTLRDTLASLLTPADDAPIWQRFPGDTDSQIAAQGAQGYQANPEAVASAPGRYLQGVVGAGSRMRDEMFPPGNPLSAMTFGAAGGDDSGVAQRKADIAAYQRKLASGELGPAGTFGDMTPEVAASLYPVARASTAISKLPLTMRLLGARYAPLAGDIIANAGYNAGRTGLSGGSLGDTASAAAWGAAGALGGRAMADVGGRLVGGITPEARTLLSKGVTPTYGQAFGNEGIVAAAERGLSGVSLAGGAVDAAKARAMGQYSEAEVRRVLDGTGIPYQGAGFKAVRQVNEAIHQGYEEAKPQTFLHPQDVKRAAGQARQTIRDIPLLTEQQGQQVAGYYNQTIAPQIARAERAGGVIDGVTARKIDVQLGDLAHTHLNSLDPTHHALGQAFLELQMALKGALRSNDPAVIARLQQLNRAYSGMVGINVATERAANAGGYFTPNQYRSAIRSDIPGYDPRLALNNTARETLNEPGTGLARSLSRNLGVPALGGAAAYGAHAMGIPPPVIAGGAAALTAGGIAGSRLLYSEPGIRTILAFMDLLPNTARWLSTLPPEGLQEFVQRMIQESPISMRQTMARAAAAYAQQQQPQGATQ